MTEEIRKEALKQADGKSRKKLFDFIRRKVSNDLEAEDILQDVYYSFFDTLRFESIEKAGAWLYRTAGNKVIDWYRKHKTVSLDKIKTADNHDEADDALYLEDILYDPGNMPDELYMRATIQEVLSDALEELPEEQKEVFVMHELEGLSFKEISEITKVPVKTLLSRKHYAILFLREELREIYEEFSIK